MEPAARASWIAIAVVLAACEHEAPPDAAEPAETWWERPDMGWWWKGGKDPKEAELVTCDELAPGFATMWVSEIRATSNYHARISGCDVELSWASWWPSQLLQKQLSRMPGCADCDFDVFDEGFTLAESVVHLRVVQRDGRLVASFDSRWRPDLDEALFAHVPFLFRRAGGARSGGSLRSDCPAGSYSRRCLRLTHDTAGLEASP